MNWFFGGEVREFLKHELSKTQAAAISHVGDDWYHDAEGIVDPSRPGRDPVPIGEIIQMIALLAKIESATFSVFMFLQEQGLVTMEGLKEPMTLINCAHDEIRLVINALDCFRFFNRMDKPKSYVWPEDFAFSGYMAVRIWLATVVVRGALTTDMHSLINLLSTFDGLGSLNREELRELWPATRKLQVGKSAGFIPALKPGRAQSFCFFLPLTTRQIGDIDEVCRSFDSHFVPLEKLFFNVFKLKVRDDLPNEELPAGYFLERAKRKQSKKMS
ncbi:uncharacterized protein PAC_13910 [Phialocephala subalpina]|uniref:Uncharacterized protein n=1 Tax=Phialocephala subalpina TaxID=576137 RepID=A0A1L7XG38_9HELO|nr:uncharacterized protein PAC_13910 [Phialocephala subalpina]